MAKAYWTHVEIARHTPFLAEASQPIRGWRVDERGNLGEAIVIPKGAKLISHDRTGCLKLLALYSMPHGVADVLQPDGTIEYFFFDLKDAAEALPPEPEGFRWCTPHQAYHVTCDLNFGEERPICEADPVYANKCRCPKHEG